MLPLFLLACALPVDDPADWRAALSDPSPPPDFGLSAPPELEIGARAEWTAAGVPPGTTVFFVRGGGLGAGPCPGPLGGTCLDVRAPVSVLGSARAGGDGVAVFGVTLPPAVPPGFLIAVQAAVPGSPGLVSDAVASVAVPPLVDADGDGFPEGEDCDDTDATVHPGAPEVCFDGIDQDCDGAVDASTFFFDADADGFGDPDVPLVSCEPVPGFARDGGDCDDTDAGVNPDAAELCDGRDGDCDGVVESPDPLGGDPYFPDLDRDGHGDAEADAVISCGPEDGYVASSDDCDDTDASIRPSALEIWYDGVDQDCSGGSDYDQDADGFDAAPWGADCDDTDADLTPLTPWFLDLDHDGYGDDAVEVAACDPGDDWSRVGGDCDDADAGVSPGAEEVCDGRDTDCNGYGDRDVPGDHATIQDALDAAVDGETVCVGPGVWPGTIDFGGRSVAVLGAGVGVTTLDGEGAGPVVTIASGEGAGTALGGLTILGGDAHEGGGVYTEGTSPRLHDLHLDSNAADWGGGLYAESPGSPTLEDVTFTSNVALWDGGGLYADHATLVDVTFTTNVAANGAGARIDGGALTRVTATSNTANENGGGLFFRNGDLVLTDVEAIGNGAVEDGGGIYSLEAELVADGVTVRDNVIGEYGRGAGLALHTNTRDEASRIDRLVAEGNHVDVDWSGTGGGVYLQGCTDRCRVDGADWVVRDNAVASGAGIAASALDVALDRVDVRGNHGASQAGGVLLSGADLDLTNAVIAGNTLVTESGAFGAGLHADWLAEITLTNVAIVGNTIDAMSTSQGGGLYLDNDATTLVNVLLADNVADEGAAVFAVDGAPVDTRHSCTWDGDWWGVDDPTGIDGNIAADPLLVGIADPDPLLWDLHPALGSPLVDAGDPALLDPDGSVSDIGAYGGPGGTW